MTAHSRHTFPIRRAVPAFLVVLLAVLVGLTVAGPAAAAGSPCGQKILDDWFDNGRVDRLYPLHCYEEAIDLIPRDIRDYSDAQEVISRALQAAVGGHLAPGGDDPTPGDDSGGSGGSGGNGGNGGSGGPGDPDGSGGPQAAPEVDTTSASSVPIPLIVLGGMSLALLAAGGLGYYSRRRQAANGSDDLDGPTIG